MPAFDWQGEFKPTHSNMKNAEFIVISAPKHMDQFMKAADLFRAKNLGTIKRMTVEYNEKTSISLDRAKAIIPVIKEGLEKAGRIVSFIHLVKVRNGDTIKLNSSIKPYVDMTAREISNGHTSFVFKDYIEIVTGFKCEIDEHYYIKNIV